MQGGKIRGLWHHLANRGIHDRLSEPEKKRELIFNQFLLLTFVIWLVEFAVIMIAVALDLASSVYFLPNLSILVSAAIVFYLRGHNRSELLRFVIYFILLPHGIVISLFLGPEYQYHLFVIVFIFAPFFVATHNIARYFAAATLPAILLAGLFVWYEFYGPLYPVDRVLLPYVKYTSIVTIAGMVLSMSYALWKDSTDAENVLESERSKSDKLLLNVLPAEIARELKDTGIVKPRHYENVAIIFTDFCGFTKVAETMQPSELIRELDLCFSYFDSVIAKYGLEKLKTIGDAYMCASGLPMPKAYHVHRALLAAMEIQIFMEQMKQLRIEKGLPYWELRLGMHSGPVIAGVIGEQKFAYDIWGDTVNTASRFESSGEMGRINVSQVVYEQTSEVFDFEFRGQVKAKNKGEMEMYFLRGIKADYSVDGNGRVPNAKFPVITADPGMVAGVRSNSRNQRP